MTQGPSLLAGSVSVAHELQVTHARSGGIYEIMGVMYGKVRDHTFWIMDAAALPVQGTETRVNAGNEVCDKYAPKVC